MANLQELATLINNAAMRRDQYVALRYRDVKGDLTVRVILPSSPYQTKAGDLVVKALCALRLGEFRTFRLDRVESAAVVD